MFLAYNNDLIVLAANTIEEIENAPLINYDRIEETSETYILVDGVYVTKEEQLSLAKTQKKAECLQKAIEAEENGSVLYKNAVFETSASNMAKLTSQFAMIQVGLIDSVQWLSKDDVQMELTSEDIMALGQLIADYTGALWNVQYLNFMEQIENANSLEELNLINIEY